MIISLWAPDTLENGTESSAVLDCVYNFTEQVLVVDWLVGWLSALFVGLVIGWLFDQLVVQLIGWYL